LSERLRDFLVSLSLANLCFLSVWIVLLKPSHYLYYNWREDPGLNEIMAVTIAVLSLTSLFWVGTVVVRRIRSRVIHELARFLFLITPILPLNSLSQDYFQFSFFSFFWGRLWLRLSFLGVSILVLIFLYRYRRSATNALVALLMILSPLFALNLLTTLWLCERVKPNFQTKQPQFQVPTKADAPRIVWIIFDELEERLVFAARPQGFKFPAFDRFRAESLVASNAFPPNRVTMSSLPSLLTGKLLQDAEPIAANDLALHASDGSIAAWSNEPNIFSEVRVTGLSAGLMGWYHPYCRVIGDDLDFCGWAPHVGDPNPVSHKLTLGKAIARDFLTVWWRVPFTFRLFQERYEAKEVADYRGVYEEISSQANVLLDRGLNLTFLHYPVPHEPWIDKTSNPSTLRGPTVGYLNNVVLADKTLGELRKRLEAKDLWDGTVVLISGDHWWRDSPLDSNGSRDHRVPFMLKLAGQRTQLSYDTPFNTLLTRELLILILQGKLKSESEVAAWLTHNTHLAESPFTIAP